MFVLRGGSVLLTQVAANWDVLGLGWFWMGNGPQGPDPSMATFWLVPGKGLTIPAMGP